MFSSKLESDRYIVISHAGDHKLLLRGCQLISPYRAGFEDCLYNRCYANPFVVGSPQWSQYDAGNSDARKSQSERRDTL